VPGADTLIAASILLPLGGALASFLLPALARRIAPLVAALILADVAALALAVAGTGPLRHEVGGWGAPLGIALYADGLAALLLLTAGLACTAVLLYALRYFEAGDRQGAAFWPLALVLWTGLNALFLSADLFNLYVTLELIGLSAVALVALAGGTAALTAAMRYLLVTFLGSLTYLLGVALLYHQTGTLDLAMLAERVAPVPAAWLATGLIGAAMIIKCALFPVHFWLPPAHSNAPTPVSALLSALVVKAPVYLLLRYWLAVVPDDAETLGSILAALGALAILWGSVQALRQTRLKLLVAYSTIAQIGYLFLPFGIGAAHAATAWRGAAYLMLCHALAKTAVFLAAGNLQRYGGHDRIVDIDHAAQHLPVTLAAFAIAGVTLMGLPPSGGFVAKWLILEAAIADGSWWLVAVILVGSLLAGTYVFKVVGLAFTEGRRDRKAKGLPRSLEWVALVVALLTLLLAFGGPMLFPLLDAGSPFGAGPAV
jgi:formate hydrogenlyase subunit 3/multisubunit Na+/H+ antiporter MnhD subunit